VEEIAERLKLDAERSKLAERLSAMASLARGDTGAALRRLRQAADEAKSARSGDQCRTQLALAVGLARAERVDEALLSALSGLARARETHDRRGEQACLRFIEQLNRGAGYVELAEKWHAASKQ
jgi:hypothetical protein